VIVESWSLEVDRISFTIVNGRNKPFHATPRDHRLSGLGPGGWITLYLSG
jgi:hypothetical protein